MKYRLLGNSGLRVTVFTLVDALTRIAGRYEYVGDRTEIDQKASGLLALAV